MVKFLAKNDFILDFQTILIKFNGPRDNNNSYFFIFRFIYCFNVLFIYMVLLSVQRVFLQRRSVRVENIFNWIYIGRVGRGSIINTISCN